MHQHGIKYSAHRPLLVSLGGVKRFFSEDRHHAYQINGNVECSNMQAHILSKNAPSTHGVGVKGQNIFSESSQCFSKLERSIEHILDQKIKKI